MTRQLPVGTHPLQLYSLGTPNGHEGQHHARGAAGRGAHGAEYDAWFIDIGEGDQFGSGFVEINPNSKIPALLDRTDPGQPQRVFESGAILLYLAEKFGAFLPKEPAARTEALNWLFWQMGAGPVRRRRLRPFLRLCAGQDSICDRPLRDGGEAAI